MKKQVVIAVAVLVGAVAAFCAYKMGAASAAKGGTEQTDVGAPLVKDKPLTPKKRLSRSGQEPKAVPVKASTTPDEVKALDSGRQEVSRSKLEADVAEIARDIAKGLEAGDEKSVRELMRQLSCFKRPTLMRALQGLIRHGDAEERKNALYALAVAFGAGTKRTRTFAAAGGGESFGRDNSDFGTISDGIPDTGNAEEQAAQQSHDIISAVGEGLQDDESSVRQAAYETMRALDDEESSVLAQQLLCGDDAALKRQLLSDVAGSSAEQDIKTSIAGLENSDPAVHQQAMANLKAVSGQDLATQEAAFDWLEKNVEANTANAPGSVVGDGEAIAAPKQ